MTFTLSYDLAFKKHIMRRRTISPLLPQRARKARDNTLRFIDIHSGVLEPEGQTFWQFQIAWFGYSLLQALIHAKHDPVYSLIRVLQLGLLLIMFNTSFADVLSRERPTVTFFSCAASLRTDYLRYLLIYLFI